MTSLPNEYLIAVERDIAANSISDMSIYRSVVENVVNMSSHLDDKVDILLEAIPDLGIIIAQLSLCKSRGLLIKQSYSEIVNHCLLKINERRGDIKLDPSHLGLNSKEV